MQTPPDTKIPHADRFAGMEPLKNPLSLCGEKRVLLIQSAFVYLLIVLKSNWYLIINQINIVVKKLLGKC